MSQLIFMFKSKEVPLEVKFGVSDLLSVYLSILYYTILTERFQVLPLPLYMTFGTALKCALSLCVRRSWIEIQHDMQSISVSPHFSHNTIRNRKLTFPEGHPGGTEHLVPSLNEVPYQKIQSALLATITLQRSFNSDWNQPNNSPINLCWCISPPRLILGGYNSGEN